MAHKLFAAFFSLFVSSMHEVTFIAGETFNEQKNKDQEWDSKFDHSLATRCLVLHLIQLHYSLHDIFQKKCV